MAKLPDIDTTAVSYLGYWNAIDQGGADSIDPSDALSDSSLIDYTLYDNGWEGTYSSATGRVLTVRVKNDGWFVAYIDRTTGTTGDNSPTQDVSQVRGPWDLINAWSVSDGTGSLSSSTFHAAIQSLQSNLSNAGNITYADADVGLYNYQYTSSTTVTMLGVESGGNQDSRTPGAQFTSETTRNQHHIVASAFGNSTYDQYQRKSSFNNWVLIDQTDGADWFGAVDALSQSLMPNADTEYTGDFYNGDNHIVTSQYQLVAWE